MKKASKIWLIAAASVILIGCILFCGVMTVLNWDFTKLSTNQYETKRYEIHENYQNISIVTDISNIEFAISENADTAVTCDEQKNVTYSVSVRDNSLMIEVMDTKKWYEYIGIHFGTPKIILQIPQETYGSLSVNAKTGNIFIPKELAFESMDIATSTGNVTNNASVLGNVKIETTTGNIRVENISAQAMDLSASTGKITVSDVTCTSDVTIGVSTGKVDLNGMTCQTLTSSGSTGNLSLKNVIASKSFSLKRTTGNIKFDACDANEMVVKTTTGTVTGTLLSKKIFVATTDTGHVSVPNNGTSGGRCEIKTDTGNIKIALTK